MQMAKGKYCKFTDTDDVFKQNDSYMILLFK